MIGTHEPKTSIESSGFVQEPEAQLQERWRDAFARLRALFYLDSNWDGEAALAPDPARLQCANDLMSALEEEGWSPPSRILPTFDGNVLLEWQTPNTYEEAEITSPGRVEWMRRDENGIYSHWVWEIENLWPFRRFVRQSSLTVSGSEPPASFAA